MGKVAYFILLFFATASVMGDLVRLSDIQKALHGLAHMMEKTWTEKNTPERRTVFELYTCLGLTKDLELLVFNRTEIFLEDEMQTCSCRRVHGKLETQGGGLSENSTFTTDLFIKILISTLDSYEDHESLSQSFTHFQHNWLSSRRNESHIHPLHDVLVKLTPMENAMQILTRFVVKQWAVETIKDQTLPVFELYTCTSLLRQIEEYLQAHPGMVSALLISMGKPWYVPCTCQQMQELADTHCQSLRHCAPTFSIVHTMYEDRVHQISKRMPLPPELTRDRYIFD